MSKIRSDQIIQINSIHVFSKLRQTGYKGLEAGKLFQFLTNNFALCAKTIPATYKDFEKVEICFRTIEPENKSFCGAVKERYIDPYMDRNDYLFVGIFC